VTIIQVGVDIAKSIFYVHGVDRHDQVRWPGKYSRQKWLDALCKRVLLGLKSASKPALLLITGRENSKPVDIM
jgi:hypothetical protein